jgi:hypothetical protein
MANLAIPSLSDLVEDSEKLYKDNALAVILNQDPPPQWLKNHPTVKVENEKGDKIPLKYLPIARVEYLLTRIFTKWWSEIKDVKLLANSVVVTVRVYVVNPVTGETEWNDGVGASPLQIKANSGGAVDFANMQSAAVMMAAPSAKSYAIKDAAENWGKLFGKDLGRKDEINYDSLLREEKATLEEVTTLYEKLMELAQFRNQEYLTPQDIANIDRVIKHKEDKTYNLIRKQLEAKLKEVE